ncbi:MAG: aspartate kinase [Abditibacteriota bacterium]|nr:aspartate kinase [Abditibacteriota bacterium]MBP5717823.1 aspartate kinase [Abditibacteriota bacterium]MBP5738419.1 aspartate kinase [Abditibacteriota bacterium]
MLTVVQKYGGSSVATTEKIARIAERVAKRAEKDKVVVVVSAMGDTTDELISMAKSLTKIPDERELDKLLATGEQVSSALMAMALHKLGVKAVSLTGGQAGVITESKAGKARIRKVESKRLKEELAKGNVVIVAGFQGITENSGWAEITTLGRGGSDTTAVALAAALNADACEIYTDVEGVYTADPRVEPAARKMKTISYEEMLELAGQGARVMHSRAVELGQIYGVDILVAHSLKDAPGTLITREDHEMNSQNAEMEIRNPVRGIAHDTDVTRITIVGVPDKPGVAAKLFKALSDAGISVDVIVQNVSVAGKTDLSFTVADEDLEKTKKIIAPIDKDIEAADVITDSVLAKVSVVGSGMKTSPGYASTMFAALAAEGINIYSITTSEIRITCLVERDKIKAAVRALHKAFELEKA